MSSAVALPAATEEIGGPSGLPLAAVHIERAIAAMGDFHFGKWEVTIRSGEPHQQWGFRQISSLAAPLSATSFADLSERLIAALAAECATYRAPDPGTSEDEPYDSATVAVADAILPLLHLDPEAIPAAARDAYRAAMAACCRWWVIAEGDYSDPSAWCCALVRLIDLALAGTPFDNDALWMWHEKGELIPSRPPYQFPTP